MSVGTNQSGDLFYLKMRAKKDKDLNPHFEIAKADGKSKPVIKMDDVTYVSGKIKDIVNDSYEWEGKTVPTVKITMVDGDETYIVDSSFTSLLRGLLNCLANIEKPENLRISLYTSKTGYASVWVENNGEKSGFKYPWEDLKRYITTYKDDKGEERNSYVKMDEFYAKMVEEALGKRYREAYVPPTTEEIASSATEGDPLPVTEEESDDLPF